MTIKRAAGTILKMFAPARCSRGSLSLSLAVSMKTKATARRWWGVSEIQDTQCLLYNSIESYSTHELLKTRVPGEGKKKKIRKRSDNATLGKRLQLQLQQQQQRQQLQTAVTGILHTYCDCCCCTAATVAVAVAVATVAACKVKAACGHSSVSVLIICKKQCDRFGETHWSLNAL